MSVNFSVAAEKRSSAFADVLGEWLHQGQLSVPVKKATFLSFTSSAVDVAGVWDQRRADLSQCTWEKEVKDLI